jgi:glyoxylase-like metal-dependent hydrolase (beta-lactamase superfamily II)
VAQKRDWLIQEACAMTPPLKLKDITIFPVVEQQAPFFDVMEFFPTLTKEVLEENRSWLEPAFIDPASGKLVLCIQGFLVKTPHHNILIDSCVGNDKPRPARPFWNMMSSNRFEQGLAAAGVTVNDIDYVMCTHLHVDHVGWNTRLENGRWVPTFPKARYVMADRELAHWTEKEKQDAASVPWITDSVLPIVAAQRAQIVKSDFAMEESVQFIPTPGHTIDHYSVLVGRRGEDALITGDMIHSPIQGRYPELGMRADYDSRQAGDTRRRIFDRFCETSTLMCVAHFSMPSTARVHPWGNGYKFSSAA